MAENFADLKDTIQDELRIDEWPLTQLSEDILEWLDKHPDQVPGRTITESEFNEAYALHFGGERADRYEKFLRYLGFTIVADPEPTNAEKINEAYDVWDRDPQDLTFGEYLDRLGWVKAPDGDDEH